MSRASLTGLSSGVKRRYAALPMTIATRSSVTSVSATPRRACAAARCGTASAPRASNSSNNAARPSRRTLPAGASSRFMPQSYSQPLRALELLERREAGRVRMGRALHFEPRPAVEDIERDRYPIRCRAGFAAQACEQPRQCPLAFERLRFSRAWAAGEHAHLHVTRVAARIRSGPARALRLLRVARETQHLPVDVQDQRSDAGIHLEQLELEPRAERAAAVAEKRVANRLRALERL